MKPVAELLNLSGKTAIVTGGAKGIGYGITYRLAEAEASVLIADTDEEAAIDSAKRLSAKGWDVEAIKTDVSNEEDVKNMVAACIKAFAKIDILVNNAGIYPPESVINMSEADFDKVLNVNLNGVFLTTKHVSNAMVEAEGGGRIINVTSIDALHPSMIGLAHYDASKHGVWGFTKNIALELAQYKIWVNAIAPGGIQTPGTKAIQTNNAIPSGISQKQQIETFMSKIPMARMGEPDEVGKVALFLASDMASYMTGSQIVVDGGVLLS